MTPFVRFDRVRRSFDGQTDVVRDLSLDVARGEFLTLLGPSGSGKTTALMMLAGFERPDGGVILLDGQDITRTAPHKRNIGVVFQSYALFPHMSVAQNVAFPLEVRGLSRATREERVGRALDMVRLAGFGDRLPAQLSGGQQQRVALARTLAVRPRVLLLDEPFAALDKNLRLDMQIEIRRIQRELGVTTVLVTHDQEEAMSMADRIAVMNAGRVEQFDTPETVYDAPSTRFVATFVGTANLLPGRLARDGDGWVLEAEAGGRLAIARPSPCTREGAAVLAARPEHLSIVEPGPDALPATVGMVLPLGPSLVHELALADGRPIKLVRPRTADGVRLRTGERVGVALRPGSPAAVFAQ